MLTKIITSSPSSITAPVPPAKGNSIGELVAARPARAHPGRLGIKKTGEFSNAKIGENYSATDSSRDQCPSPGYSKLDRSRLATPDPIRDWSLTTLKEKLIKIGAKVISHSRKHGRLSSER
jgi:hypothetical protein